MRNHFFQCKLITHYLNTKQKSVFIWFFELRLLQNNYDEKKIPLKIKSLWHLLDQVAQGKLYQMLVNGVFQPTLDQVLSI